MSVKMAQLRPEMHSLLNEYVIRLLKKNKIDTLADFMREDENKLMKIMNIDGSGFKIHVHLSTAFPFTVHFIQTDLRDLSAIKRCLAAIYGILPIDGLTYYNKLAVHRPTQLPTHIKQ